MKKLVIVLLLFTLASMVSQSTSSMAVEGNLTVYYTSNPPDVTDGLKGTEWAVADSTILSLSDNLGFSENLDVKFYTVHDNSRIYFAVEYKDSTHEYGDQFGLLLDIDEDDEWDWNDTSEDYYEYIGAWYSFSTKDFKSSDHYYYQTEMGGEPYSEGVYNTQGYGTHSNGTYFFEISQELDSSDDPFDINLQIGDSILFSAFVNDNTSEEKITYTTGDNFPMLTIVSASVQESTETTTSTVTTSATATTGFRIINILFFGFGAFLVLALNQRRKQ